MLEDQQGDQGGRCPVSRKLRVWDQAERSFGAKSCRALDAMGSSGDFIPRLVGSHGKGCMFLKDNCGCLVERADSSVGHLEGC